MSSLQGAPPRASVILACLQASPHIAGVQDHSCWLLGKSAAEVDLHLLGPEEQVQVLAHFQQLSLSWVLEDGVPLLMHR
jgi:hypothetical protein